MIFDLKRYGLTFFVSYFWCINSGMPGMTNDVQLLLIHYASCWICLSFCVFRYTCRTCRFFFIITCMSFVYIVWYVCQHFVCYSSLRAHCMLELALIIRSCTCKLENACVTPTVLNSLLVYSVIELLKAARDLWPSWIVQQWVHAFCECYLHPLLRRLFITLGLILLLRSYILSFRNLS